MQAETEVLEKSLIEMLQFDLKTFFFLNKICEILNLLDTITINA